MLEHDHPDSLVERRIREASVSGAFDNLPGSGQPLPDAGRPYHPDWWLRRWMERNGIDSRRFPLFPPGE